MNSSLLILLVLVVIYIPLWVIVWRRPGFLGRCFEKYGPIIKINTRFGLRFIERFGKYHRFWRAFGIFSQLVSLALMVMMVYIMLNAVINLPRTLSAGGVGVEYVLAIPGLNPMLPLWYGVLALVIAMVCHEMAHGLQSRSNGIGVKHTGLLYGVVPLGAFVEPDQDDVQKASRRAKIDLYTAGISTNFILAAVTFLIFSMGMLGTISSPYDDYCAVYNESADSPVIAAGIPAGAIITEVGGEQFTFTSDYCTTPIHSWLPGTSQTVRYLTADGEYTANIVWGVYVQDTVAEGPGSVLGLKGTWISSIEKDSTVNYFYTADAFSKFMSTTHGGDTVTVNYYRMEGDIPVPAQATTTLDSNGSVGYLGVYTTTSGMGLITPRIMLETAANPLYGATDLSSAATSLLRYISHPLSGFDPIPDSVKWWYGEQCFGYWQVCTALFWIFWINIMLGVTNALPAFPFDGGYVFLGWVDTLMEKAGVRDREARAAKAEAVVRNVSSLMMFMYLLVIVAAIM